MESGSIVRAKREERFAFFDKIAGRIRLFVPKSREAIVTLSDKIDEGEIREILRSKGVGMDDSIDDPRRVTRMFSGNPLPETEVFSGIVNTIPVVVDEEGRDRYFLPDELIVLAYRLSVVQVEGFVKDKELAGSRVLDFRYSASDGVPSLFVVTVPSNRSLFETIEAFAAWDEIIYAGPSEVSFDHRPDVSIEVEGSLIEGELWSLKKIEAARAWKDFTEGHPNVIVSVVDSGADLSHPDLDGNLLPRNGEDWDILDPVDRSPDDVVGHGTHICGTAAGVRNGSGVIGVAPGCRLMPLRVSKLGGYNRDRIAAMYLTTGKSIQHPELRFVINCSWPIQGDDSALHDAIRRATRANVLVVASAGNDGIEYVPYPAAYVGVIAVAATKPSDRKWEGSNYGKAVDVSAPGFEITSTWPGGKYAILNGTSYAAPHVSGLAALIWSRNLSLANWQVRTILERSCDPIDNLNVPAFRGKLGKGRINAFRALSITPP